MRLMPAMHISLLLCIFAGISLRATPALSPTEAPESPEIRDARMAWFRDAHFGMFIHFGLYSTYGGVWKGQVRKVNNCAEWMMLAARAPRAEYAKAAQTFNPTGFDADAWIQAVKNAGMRYIVITTKHHEGFALFRTKASPYNIVDATPFGRDVIAEIAAACRRHGVRLGLYYSQNLDWYHPGGGGGEWDPTHAGDSEAYVRNIAIPQLRELMTNYGTVDLLWYDIANGVVSGDNAWRIHQMVHRLQPNIVVNNRLGRGTPYDVQTPENFIPATGIPGKDWESCISMNNSWGYAADDHNWKSTRELLHRLADITSKGGNMLLNMGPDGSGRMPEEALRRLREMGDWLRTNGEAIYETRAAVFPQTPSWGRFTLRHGADGNDTLYAIVFDPPASGELLLPGLTTPIRSAYRLDNGKKLPLKVRQGAPSGPSIVMDKEVGALQDFVIAITLDGQARVSEAIAPDAEGAFVLLPRLAKCHGGMRVEEINITGLDGSHTSEEHLGYWLSPSAGAQWSFHSHQPAKYTVELRYAAPEASAGSAIALVVGEQSLPFIVRPTGSWNRFTSVNLGEVSLPAGTHTLSLRLDKLQGEAPCNVGILRLKPVP